MQHLLKLFGCDSRDGRPEGAPVLREGHGGTTGETLGCVETAHKLGKDVDAIAYLEGEREFPEVSNVAPPATWWENQWVPEAQSYSQTSLPHQCSNQELLFPRAVVSEWKGGHDFEEDVGELERRGQQIGRDKSGKSIDEGATSGRGKGALAKQRAEKIGLEQPKTASWSQMAQGNKGRRWADIADDEEVA